MTSRESDKFMLRLPDGMRDKIKASAERNGRSMNAEVVHALQFYFDFEDLNQSRPVAPEQPEDIMEEPTIRVANSNSEIDAAIVEMAEKLAVQLKKALKP